MSVAHLYFEPYIDFNEVGVSQLSNTPCVRPSDANTRYWVCDFIPAWQMFELTFVPGGGGQPITAMLPVAYVKRWKRS